MSKKFVICPHEGMRYCSGMDKDDKCPHRKKHLHGSFCDDGLCHENARCVPYENNKDRSKIPHGPYCYEGKRRCPYWSFREDKPDQESGYCAFLGKGDWDTNASTEQSIVFSDGTKTSPSEMPIGIGLLWDSVKECGINEEYESEEE